MDKLESETGKRYLIWRDSDTYHNRRIYCDVLVIDEDVYSLPYYGLFPLAFDAHSYGAGLNSGMMDLAVSIVFDYKADGNHFPDDANLWRKFANTFLGLHRAGYQNFYIDENEIRLFLELENEKLELQQEKISNE